MENDDDCDDDDAETSPDADEDCTGIDDYCDGTVDEDEAVLGSHPDCPADDCDDIATYRPGLTDATFWFTDGLEISADECDFDNPISSVPDFTADIQPIFNARCVSCHGKDKSAGGLRLTGEVTTYYNTSYEQLARKELAGPLISEFTSFRRGDQGNYNGGFLPPRSLGCAKSTMIDMLTHAVHPQNVDHDHSQMLTEMELMILSRWVDTNYQFYGTYYGRHHALWVKPDPNKPTYEPTDFRRRPTFEEATSFFAPEWHR